MLWGSFICPELMKEIAVREAKGIRRLPTASGLEDCLLDLTSICWLRSACIEHGLQLLRDIVVMHMVDDIEKYADHDCIYPLRDRGIAWLLSGPVTAISV